MKTKPIQMLLPLKFPKRKAVQMTFRFSAIDKPKPIPNTKGQKLDKFL